MGAHARRRNATLGAYRGGAEPEAEPHELRESDGAPKRRSPVSFLREFGPAVAIGFVVGHCAAPDAPDTPAPGLRAETRRERPGPLFVDATGLDGFLAFDRGNRGTLRLEVERWTPWILGSGHVAYELGLAEYRDGTVRVGYNHRFSDRNLFGEAFIGEVHLEAHGPIVFARAPYRVGNLVGTSAGSLTATIARDPLRDELVVTIAGEEHARLPRLRPPVTRP